MVVPTAMRRVPGGGRAWRRGWRGHLVDFAVDGVGLDGVGRDGFEGAEADMEGDVGGAHAGGLERGQQLRREMQTGGRRGGGDLPGAVGVDGLVAF